MSCVNNMKFDPDCPGCICCDYSTNSRARANGEKAFAEAAYVSSHPKHKGIVCPECTGVGPFRLVEDIRCWRPIYGMTVEGGLVAGSFYHTGEGYDDGNNMRIECHSKHVDEQGREVFCGCDFELPNDVYDKIEWA